MIWKGPKSNYKCPRWKRRRYREENECTEKALWREGTGVMGLQVKDCHGLPRIATDGWQPPPLGEAQSGFSLRASGRQRLYQSLDFRLVAPELWGNTFLLSPPPGFFLDQFKALRTRELLFYYWKLCMWRVTAWRGGPGSGMLTALLPGLTRIWNNPSWSNTFMVAINLHKS